jgi:hypothetical protein
MMERIMTQAGFRLGELMAFARKLIDVGCPAIPQAFPDRWRALLRR